MAFHFAIAAFARSPHDFTRFEDEVLPAWLARFTVDHTTGKFSYYPQPAPATLYGSIDAIHILASVGALGNLTMRDAWAAQIDGHQPAPGGFYTYDGSHGWHRRVALQAVGRLHAAAGRDVGAVCARKR